MPERLAGTEFEAPLPRLGNASRAFTFETASMWIG